ncbi:MAG TPA: cytidine deaminase [Candidatus Eisenbacteria bacterium]|jgi:cytidine deaminase|nr:cytidine deaminase [Candidatus Eisenbacteria bacterium]
MSDGVKLLEAARVLLAKAHAPYSHYRVAAALEDEHGVVHPGVNVESASLGLTICAERNALFGALARGARRFRRIAIATDPPGPCVPCGACRQVLVEHAPDLEVIVASPEGAPEMIPLRDLLPRPFLTF